MPSGALCAPNGCAGGQRGGGARFVAGAEVGIEAAVSVRDGPAVVAPFDDAVQLAGRLVVAEQIAPVVGGVQVARARLPVEAHGVAEALREDLAARCRPVRSAAWPRGARPPRCRRCSSSPTRHVEAPVRADAHGSRPVVPAGGKPGHDALQLAGRAAGLGVEADRAPPPSPRRCRASRRAGRCRAACRGRRAGSPGRREGRRRPHRAARRTIAPSRGHAHQQVARRRRSQEARLRHLGVEARRVAVRGADAGAERLGSRAAPRSSRTASS